MDSSNIQSPHTPTDEQMAILVVVIPEKFGAGLPRVQLNKMMLAIFTPIPGFEALARKRSVQNRKVLSSKYHQEVR